MPVYGWRLLIMKARYRWPLWVLASLVVLLVALHIALPYLCLLYTSDAADE